MDETDLELIKRYALRKCEDAFAELVRRHIGLVYSTALRQVYSPALAEEVAQMVFLDLARQAEVLSSDTVLAAWLYRVARCKGIDLVRRETRRQLREKVAVELSAMNTSSPDWSELEPFLDEAMETLSETDRAAILLRYFQNKSLREVGITFGMSENAAQKRLSRAMERLNQFFTGKGIKIGAGGLATLISANGVQAVPVTLTSAICCAVGAAQTAATAAVSTTTITAMTTLQKTFIAASLVAAIGTGFVQSRRAATLQKEVQSLAAQLPRVEEFERMSREREVAMAQLADLQAEVDGQRANSSELLRLRGEVTRLRAEAKSTPQAETTDPTMEIAAKNWVDRVSHLKQHLEKMPGARVLELQLLTPEDWLAAVKQPSLETEEDYRRATATLRNLAQGKFAGMIQPALAKYLEANNQVFPTEMAQLQAYVEPAPIDPAMLERYGILPASAVPNVKMGGEWVITQKAPIDPEFDLQIAIGPLGHGSSSFPRENELSVAEIDLLTPALHAYTAAHGGQEPTHPAQVEPFLTTDEQRMAYEKAIRARERRAGER